MNTCLQVFNKLPVNDKASRNYVFFTHVRNISSLSVVAITVRIIVAGLSRDPHKGEVLKLFVFDFLQIEEAKAQISLSDPALRAAATGEPAGRFDARDTSPNHLEEKRTIYEVIRDRKSASRQENPSTRIM